MLSFFFPPPPPPPPVALTLTLTLPVWITADVLLTVVFVLLNLDPNQTLTFQLSVPPPTAFASSVVRSGDQQATGTKQQQNDGARVAAPQLSVWELYGQVR